MPIHEFCLDCGERVDTFFGNYECPKKEKKIGFSNYHRHTIKKNLCRLCGKEIPLEQEDICNLCQIPLEWWENSDSYLPPKPHWKDLDKKVLKEFGIPLHKRSQLDFLDRTDTSQYGRKVVTKEFLSLHRI